jgi:hypothetical protein
LVGVGGRTGEGRRQGKKIRRAFWSLCITFNGH